jgi:AraC family transcriptional regulator
MHINRLNKVLNYAHTNWNESLDLARLADVACMSQFHFSRVFRQYTGESPVGFVKRIRFESSAHMLCYQQNKAIGDIALNCGFSSNQTFTRAFTNEFGSCPREFRYLYRNKLEKALPLDQSNQYADCITSVNIEVDPDSSDSSVKLIQLPPTKVAYFRSIGGYGISDDIDLAYTSIRHWAQRKGLWNSETKIIGASWDNNRITPNTFCKYDACIQIPQNITIESDVSVQLLPGGLYAVFRSPFQTSGEISLIWRYFTELIAKTRKFEGYYMNSKPCFEILGVNPITQMRELALYIRMIRLPVNYLN